MYPTGSPDAGSSWRNCLFTPEEAQNLTGATASDQAGQTIGQVATVYRDKATGEPEWLTVMTGLFGMKETLVPAPRARARTGSLANLAIAPAARPTEEVSSPDSGASKGAKRARRRNRARGGHVSNGKHRDSAS